MKIFTIDKGSREGVEIETFEIKSGDIKIPAILIGESGRGRKLGVLPVQLSPENYKKWQEGEKVNIFASKIGETKSGRPKLIEVDASTTTDENVIIVLRTQIGFRGHNTHTGDVASQWWELDRYFIDKIKNNEMPLKNKYSNKEKNNYHKILKQVCPGEDYYFIERFTWKDFPGDIICKGQIAQGDAGYAGRGDQYVAVISKNTVFRTAYTGRLYGQPKEHYYVFKEGNVLYATWDERTLTDIF